MHSFFPANTEETLELRAPLPPEHGPDVSSQYLSIVHQHLCRMYMASELLLLNTEARFASLVIFQRYSCHYFHTDYSRSSTTPRMDHDESKRKDSNPQQQQQRQQQQQQQEQQQQQQQQQQQHHHEHLGVIAAACLFLGSKSMDSPIRLRDVINVSHKLDFACQNENRNVRVSHNHNDKNKTNTDHSPSSLLASPPTSTTPPMQHKTKSIIDKVHVYENEYPPDLDQTYWDMKDNIIRMEQSVLRLLHFDFDVSMPHKALILIAQVLGMVTQKDPNASSPITTTITKTNQSLSSSNMKKTQSIHNDNHSITIIQTAWTILNQIVFHATILRFDVVTLACAVLYRSIQKWKLLNVAQMSNHPPSKIKQESVPHMDHYDFPIYHTDAHWWISFGVTDELFYKALQSLKEYNL